MHPDIKLTEKYERQGWPSLQRPDIKPPEGWSLPLITSVNRVRDHCLSPDGQQLAFIWDRDDLSDIYVMPANGGWPARLSVDRGPTAYWDDEIPQWSPDGQWLAFTMAGHVHIVPVAGGLPRKVTDFTGGAFAPVWLPDSQRLIVAVERHEANHLLLTDRDGSWPRSLTNGPGDDSDARPSPDGSMVVHVFRPFDDLNRYDLKLVDLDSGQTDWLAGAPGQKNWSPRWSPDGQLIAFLSQRSGWNEIWLIRPDGHGERQLTHVGYDMDDIAWSPDGSRLACTVNRGGAIDLALVDARNGEVAFLGAGQGCYVRPNWPPHGDFLTVEHEDPTRPPDLYRVALPGSELTQLTFSNPPALARNGLAVPERVSYLSFDDLEIPAFLYRPAKPNGAAILCPHGGPTSQYVFWWDILAQYLVAKGYTYLCPNYRGGTGYGVEFEHANHFAWGIGDTQDCLHGARYLRELDWVDPQRIAIYGGSYGGYMTACCLSRDPDYLFACGVSKYGDARLLTSWAQCNRQLRLYTEAPLGHPSRHRQVYLDGSPIYQVEQVQKPVLILHGLEDDVVPPEASEEWVAALRRAGKTFEYKTYPGEPHGFLKRANLLDVWAGSRDFWIGICCHDGGNLMRQRRGRTSRFRPQPDLPILRIPFRQLRNPLPPLEIITPEQVEQIHQASLHILENIGLDFLDDEAMDIRARAGAKVDRPSRHVWLERGLVMEAVAKAPPVFTWRARNPQHNILVGENAITFGPCGGMAYIADPERGRRPGTLEDLENFLKLSQMCHVLHYGSWEQVAPQDIPVSTRHLHRLLGAFTLTDKAVMEVAHGREITTDCLKMAEIVFGDLTAGGPVIGDVINVNSPLRYDARMLGGLITYARAGQVCFITPFILAGAMSPITMASALAQQNAEALAGIGLTQLVNPGAPVIYGGFTTNVDMKSGGPAFGTPEGGWALLVGAQLARRYRLPYRGSGGLTNAKLPDAQAAYEIMWTLWPAVMGHTNLVMHAAGWLDGGLTASYEKFMIDVEMLAMFHHFLHGFAIDDESLALEMIAAVGSSGHHLGTPHTLARHRTEFYQSALSQRQNYESWLKAGAPDTMQRANIVWKELLARYEAPLLDPAIKEALQDYVNRREEALAGKNLYD